MLASILIVCAVPIMALITLVIRMKDGSPVIYKGVRLGIDKKPFVMYKFRTLSKDAQKIIGAELLTAQAASTRHLLTSFGRFLRETRLDELPQLFNILKGDMDFLGPRPERPEIYEKFCKQIKGYDERFEVKPGLIGYSQLFTPHSSPKRIRTLIDNKLLRKKQNPIWDIGGVFVTILIVLRRTIKFGVKLIWNNFIKSRILRLFEEKRSIDRIRQEESMVYFGPESNGNNVFPYEGRLIDINEEAVLVYSNEDTDEGDFIIKMETICKRFFKKRKIQKTAFCRGSIYKKISLVDNRYRYAYVMKYIPVSPLNSYMVHQYFLHESVI